MTTKSALPKVILGPGCSNSLQTSTEQGLKRLLGDSFERTQYTLHHFADGDSLFQINQNVRGEEVYIVQPCNPPAENLLHLLMAIDAAILASAGSVTVVFPYYPGRQDRKDRPRVGVTAAMLARIVGMLLSGAPRRQVMILEPHSDQIHMAFNGVACDLLYATSILLRALDGTFALDRSRIVSAGPDVGSIKLARKVAEFFGISGYAHGDKRHIGDDRPKIVNIIGDVDGKIVVLRDDIVDTAGSACDFISLAEDRGATDCYIVGGHGVFAGKAIENLQRMKETSILRHVLVTDSINNDGRDLPTDLITVVSCGDLLAQAIFQNHTNGSITTIAGMFDIKKA